MSNEYNRPTKEDLRVQAMKTEEDLRIQIDYLRIFLQDAHLEKLQLMGIIEEIARNDVFGTEINRIYSPQTDAKTESIPSTT